MKHLLHSQRSCFFLIALFISLGASAQTHTPKTNIPIGTKCNGYYEYLPAGYDPYAKTTYPVLFFLTGIGEMGDGTPAQINRVLLHEIPKLIQQGTLPTSFTVNGRTSKFIIITPQFKQGSRPSAVNLNEVINYILPRYKINRNRIYLAGISYGGGLCWAYPGYSTTYSNRIAAIVPVASPPPPVPSGQTQDQVIYARSRNIASSNVAVWALHNRYDAGNPVSVPQTYIKYINQSPAPTPLAKLTIFEQSGHTNTWPKAFSPAFREGARNVYEWMLQFHNGKPAIVNAGTNKNLTLPSNRVTMTASASDADGYIERYYWSKISGPTQYSISSRSVLNPTISNLAAGTYTFRLTVTDNDGATSYDDVSIIVSSGSTTTKSIKVNLFGGTNPYVSAEWNNWNVSSSLTSGSLKYSNSTASSVTASITRHTLSDNGATYGGTMCPPEVLRYASYANTTRSMTISGLSTAKTYNLELYASRANSGNSTRFTINGKVLTILTDNNKTNKALFTGLVPNSGGQIIVSISNVNTYNYLNGFVLTEGGSSAPVTVLAGQTSEEVSMITPGNRTNDEEPGHNGLQIRAYPNPSSQSFNFRIESANPGFVDLSVMDASGRIVEVRQNVAANITLNLGHHLRPGTYYVEAVQGNERRRVKVLRTAQ